MERRRLRGICGSHLCRGDAATRIGHPILRGSRGANGSWRIVSPTSQDNHPSDEELSLETPVPSVNMEHPPLRWRQKPQLIPYQLIA
jgi:hypothetical protein